MRDYLVIDVPMVGLPTRAEERLLERILGGAGQDRQWGPLLSPGAERS